MPVRLDRVSADQVGATRWLQCVRCNATFEIGPLFSGCPRCRTDELGPAPVEVRSDYDDLRLTLETAFANTHMPGISRFQSLLPIPSGAGFVSLYEGNTPLVRSEKLDQATGLSALYLKNETINPTWSFKDRYNAVNISVAQAMQFRGVASLTTGNGGMAVAAYAAAAGLDCVVVCAPSVPRVMQDAFEAYGAELIIYDETNEATSIDDFFIGLVKERHLYPCVSMAPFTAATPFGVEGYKTISYEMWEQTRQIGLPQYVFCPIGGGDCIYGVYKGWAELYQSGLAELMPKICGVQPTTSNSITAAIKTEHPWPITVPGANSIASSVVANRSGEHALHAIRQSSGLAIEVTDDEITQAVRLLANAGILVEPASASTFAAAAKAVREGIIDKDARIVCILTGSGIKWPDVLEFLSS